MVKMLRTPDEWNHKHRYRRLLPSWWPKETRRPPKRKSETAKRVAIAPTPVEAVKVGEELALT